MRRLVLAATATLLSLSGAVHAQEPMDVPRLRANIRRDEAVLTEYFAKQIPAEARLPDGSVNTSHPEWQRINNQHTRAQQRLREQYGKLEKRPDILGKTANETGAKLRSTGSDPKSLLADVDLTPDTFGDGKRFVDGLKKKGYKVVDHGARWEVPEIDTVVWKPYPNEQVGSSAKDAFVKSKALPHSDAYANDGAMAAVSKGKYGAEDELGAAMANVKKGLDARSDLAVGRGDRTIGVKEELKAAWKASNYSGSEMDPGLKRMAENLKGYQTLEEAGVHNLGDAPEVQQRKLRELQERVDSSWKKSLEEGAARGDVRNRLRQVEAKQALARGDTATYRKLREELINVKTSNEVTWQTISEDYPAAANKLSGLDPESPAGVEDMARRRARVARESLQGDWKPLAKQPVEPIITDRVKAFAGRVATGLMVGGMLSGGYLREQEESLGEGRDFSSLNAALNVLKGFIEAPFAPFSIGNSIAEGEILKADAAGDSRWWALSRALWETGVEMTGHNLAHQTIEEELLAEAELARKLGRDPHEWAAKVRAAIRLGGDMTLMSPIFEAFTRDFGPERRGAEMRKQLQGYAQAKLSDTLDTVSSVQEQIEAILESGRAYDPASRGVLFRQLDRYQSAYDQLQRLLARLLPQLGPDDPMLATIAARLRDWPNPNALRAATLEAAKEPTADPSVKDVDLVETLRGEGGLTPEKMLVPGEEDSVEPGWDLSGETTTISESPVRSGEREPQTAPEGARLSQAIAAGLADCDYRSVLGMISAMEASDPESAWLQERQDSLAELRRLAALDLATSLRQASLHLAQQDYSAWAAELKPFLDAGCAAPALREHLARAEAMGDGHRSERESSLAAAIGAGHNRANRSASAMRELATTAMSTATAISRSRQRAGTTTSGGSTGGEGTRTGGSHGGAQPGAPNNNPPSSGGGQGATGTGTRQICVASDIGPKQGMSYAIVQWTTGEAPTYQLIPYRPDSSYQPPSPGRVLSRHGTYQDAKAALDRACPMANRMRM